MPIDRETFAKAPPGRLAATDEKPTVRDVVRTFLETHPDSAFTTVEIRGATAVPRGSIGPALAHLEDEGAVLHRGDYWASADRPAGPDRRTD
jgi:hypothetical protein